MDDELQPTTPVETGEDLTVNYENKQQDLMNAIEAIQIKNRDMGRRSFQLVAVALVAYWSVELIVQQPTFLWGWIMGLMAVGLGVVVWREPKASNLRYTARYAEKAPTGTAVVNAQGIILQDGTGRDPFLFADGLKIYEYKNILAVDGGKRRFCMIPLYQLEENEREALLRIVQKADRFEKVEPRPDNGFFRKK